MTPGPAATATQRTSAPVRTLDQIYAQAAICARGMYIFSLLGLFAALLLLLAAFVLVSNVGREAIGTAVRIGAIGVATGVTAVMLRRASEKFSQARKRSDFQLFVSGLAYEASYWRTSAAIGFVIVLMTIIQIVAARYGSLIGSSGAKRTVNDMRVTGRAIEDYAKQHRQYPEAKGLADLASRLKPFMSRPMPLADGWGQPYMYESRCSGGICYDYRLVSGGADRQVDFNIWEINESATYIESRDQHEIRSPGIDIIHGNGHFLLMPSRLRLADD